MIQRRGLREPAPGFGAPFAAHAARKAQFVQRLDGLVAPQQARDRIRVRLRIQLRRTNHAQAELVRRLDDANHAPPTGRLRRLERLFGGDEPGAVDDLRIDAALLRPAREGVGRTLDLVAGQLTIHGSDVNSHITLAQPKFIENDRVVSEMRVGEVPFQQIPHFPVARWLGRDSCAQGNRRGVQTSLQVFDRWEVERYGYCSFRFCSRWAAARKSAICSSFAA